MSDLVERMEKLAAKLLGVNGEMRRDEEEARERAAHLKGLDNLLTETEAELAKTKTEAVR